MCTTYAVYVCNRKMQCVSGWETIFSWRRLPLLTCNFQMRLRKTRSKPYPARSLVARPSFVADATAATSSSPCPAMTPISVRSTPPANRFAETAASARKSCSHLIQRRERGGGRVPFFHFSWEMIMLVIFPLDSDFSTCGSDS